GVSYIFCLPTTLEAEIFTRISPSGTTARNRPSAMGALAVWDFPSIGTNSMEPSLSGRPSRVTSPRTVPLELSAQPPAQARARATRRALRRKRVMVGLPVGRQKLETTSPPFIVPSARQVTRAMLLDTNRTEPSPRRTFTPPVCRLRADL